MPRIRYEFCPHCSKKKVTELTAEERGAVNKVLHNAVVIQQPYDNWRVWACHSCGWVSAARWHGENYVAWVYHDVQTALAPAPEPEPEPELEVETVTPTPVFDD